MARDLSKEMVSAVLETAFSPLECSVEVLDRGDKVSFRVFDTDGQALLNVSEISMQRLQDASGMNSVVGQCRSRLIERGYQLKPWQIPTGDNS